MTEDNDDILGLVIPETIPGALFRAVADKLHEQYPMSKRKAQVAAIQVLEVVYGYYEKVAEEEGQ